jgi:glycosyltransferase involved in cell wall biosynthesis
MHLIVDAQCLQSPDSGARGIGRYARHLLNAIVAARPDWRVDAIENARLPAIDREMLDHLVTVLPFEPLLPIQSVTRAANDRFFGEWLCTLGADAILELNFFEEHTVVPTWPPSRPPLFGVVYDLIPVLFHEHYLADVGRMEGYAERLRQFSTVDEALAISETTRADVLRLMHWPSDRVTVIGGAPEPDAGADAAVDHAAVLRGLGIDRPFFLCVAGVDARKNLQGTLAGFAALPIAVRAAHQLVIVCALSDMQREEWESRARAFGITGDVRFTGFVSDDVLRALYRLCRASVFLSLYEGLGLPVLEALRAGAPVIASNRSSIPEYSDPSTVLVDPLSTSAFVAAVETVLSRPQDEGREARRSFAARFTWDRTAAAAIAAIEATGRAGHQWRPGPPGGGRCRIAWVSPLPPTRSGIADYSRELLQHLPDDVFEIELVVSAQAVVDRALASRHRVVYEHEVHERHATTPFDLFVYHLGNSHLHVYMLELVRRYSGLVVLHDLFLGGLALRAAEVGAWPGLADDLARAGAADLADAMRRGEADHARIASEVPLHNRLVAASEAVVVHSQWSFRHLHRDADTRVFHVPMGMAAPPLEPVEAARRALGIDDDTFLVVTLGEVTASKRVDRVIMAMAAAPSPIRQHMLLCVVGDAPAALREALLADAAARGVADRIRFTGRVALTTLLTYARAADACVQLRYPVRGEASAALLRALAAGGACIVSDTEGFAEVPPDVALRVRTPHLEVEDLTAALVRLHDAPAVGRELRTHARRFVLREHRLETAAGRYQAAMLLTLAQRRRSGEWRDAAASALARAAGETEITDAVITRWAEVHVHRPGV